MLRKGWFKIPGVQDGDRTVDEQLRGLESLLARVAGRSVLDLGCAEGLIARRCLEAGARFVTAIEAEPNIHAEATRQLAGLSADVLRHDLNEPFVDMLPFPSHDVALMLAILHKLREPESTIEQVARIGVTLAVVRLPIGSAGTFRDARSGSRPVDTVAEFQRHGFRLEQVVKGPRKEIVHYWVR